MLRVSNSLQVQTQAAASAIGALAARNLTFREKSTLEKIRAAKEKRSRGARGMANFNLIYKFSRGGRDRRGGWSLSIPVEAPFNYADDKAATLYNAVSASLKKIMLEDTYGLDGMIRDRPTALGIGGGEARYAQMEGFGKGERPVTDINPSAPLICVLRLRKRVQINRSSYLELRGCLAAGDVGYFYASNDLPATTPVGSGLSRAMLTTFNNEMMAAAAANNAAYVLPDARGDLLINERTVLEFKFKEIAGRQRYNHRQTTTSAQVNAIQRQINELQEEARRVRGGIDSAPEALSVTGLLAQMLAEALSLRLTLPLKLRIRAKVDQLAFAPVAYNE